MMVKTKSLPHLNVWKYVEPPYFPIGPKYWHIYLNFTMLCSYPVNLEKFATPTFSQIYPPYFTPSHKCWQHPYNREYLKRNQSWLSSIYNQRAGPFRLVQYDINKLNKWLGDVWDQTPLVEIISTSPSVWCDTDGTLHCGVWHDALLNLSFLLALAAGNEIWGWGPVT